ncbi:uncharacterized protein LOC130544340 [Ursus arctos]|uniref:uncharacterized protein LOC130544340 n=1 Tax=Ursus arctos TaxID=9644 RepID=UPI001CF809C7|nr:uncharacterized protein LOC130544340 [Ursus arctos]
MRWVRPGPLLGPLWCTQHPEKDGDPALPPAALTGTKPALQGYLQVCLGSWHTDIPIHLNFDSRWFPEKMISNFIVSNMSYEHNAGLGRAHAELQWEERGAGHQQRARGLQTDGWTDGTLSQGIQSTWGRVCPDRVRSRGQASGSPCAFRLAFPTGVTCTKLRNIACIVTVSPRYTGDSSHCFHVQTAFPKETHPCDNKDALSPACSSFVFRRSRGEGAPSRLCIHSPPETHSTAGTQGHHHNPRRRSRTFPRLTELHPERSKPFLYDDEMLTNCPFLTEETATGKIRDPSLYKNRSFGAPGEL